MRLFRWLRRRDASDDSDLDERTREENEKFRAQHDGLQGRAQPAADRCRSEPTASSSRRRPEQALGCPSAYLLIHRTWLTPKGKALGLAARREALHVSDLAVADGEDLEALDAASVGVQPGG